MARDVGPRENQSLEALAKLKPYFDRRWGTVTVGNSCQVTDGAVALLLMNDERARSLGLPRAGCAATPTRAAIRRAWAWGRSIRATAF